MVEQNKNNILLRIVYWIVGLFGAFILITLLAALLPKLSKMEGRVNDIDKKNDLKQVEQALVKYRLENGKYPLSGGGLTTIENELKLGGLENIPFDKFYTGNIEGIAISGFSGQYLYIPITKNGKNNGGFVLMAKTETTEGSNWIFDSNNVIDYSTEVNSLKICGNLIKESYSKNLNDGNCYYKDSNDLRYIVVH